MRYIVIIILTVFLGGCDSATAPNCLKSTGSIITKEITVDSFNQLIVNNEFNVILKQSVNQSVSLTIGENIYEDISFMVNDGVLEVTNSISCKWVRDYEYPTLEITHPYLERIELIGGSHVTSTNTLVYQNLLLKAKDSNGTFKLDITSDNLTIDSNEITNYQISGIVGNLNIQFTSGDGRFEGADLIATNASVSHASSNDIIVNVSNQLDVTINSTGDLIYVGQKPNTINLVINERGSVIDGTN